MVERVIVVWFYELKQIFAAQKRMLVFLAYFRPHVPFGPEISLIWAIFPNVMLIFLSFLLVDLSLVLLYLWL